MIFNTIPVAISIISSPDFHNNSAIKHGEIPYLQYHISICYAKKGKKVRKKGAKKGAGKKVRISNSVG